MLSIFCAEHCKCIFDHMSRKFQATLTRNVRACVNCLMGSENSLHFVLIRDVSFCRISLHLSVKGGSDALHQHLSRDVANLAIIGHQCAA